jgi:copper homeostasis protein
MNYLLEVIAFTSESCRLIEKSGAGRIELCANPLEGGTTVSYGMMKSAREVVSIPVFPIIRPRGGDFLYDEEEYAIIRKDILFCREIGMDGVVTGLLNHDGTIDKARTAALVELAYPMDVTFHRAFDRARDQFAALEDIIQCGCNRILTSGGHDTVMQGLEQIKVLTAAAAERIIILPGSGIRSVNIAGIAAATGLREFHTSARTVMPDRMVFENKNLTEPASTYTVNTAEILQSLAALKNL